jgi:dihydroorotase
VAEEAIIARDVLLAEHVGSRLHVCHVSTAGSVEVLRQAKARGVRVTAEVTPHHLLLTDELAAGYDPVYKVNPPLRTLADVRALRAALIDGVIDVVATDHAPHTVEDKECEWAYARPGMVGLETALPVVLSVLGEQWDLIAERMSRAPARIAGLTRHHHTDDKRAGHGNDLVPGAPATLTLVDPAARRVVDPAELTSRGRNTPYTGTTLPGRIVATFLRGEPTVLDGKATK